MALVALLGAWIGMRTMLLTSEARAVGAPEPLQLAAAACPIVPAMSDFRTGPDFRAGPDLYAEPDFRAWLAQASAAARRGMGTVRSGGDGAPGLADGSARTALAAAPGVAFSLPPGATPARAVASVREDVPVAAAPEALAGQPGTGRRRWSLDAWLYLRRGEASAALAALTPSYGASQFGVVVRRAFGSGPRPRAFGYLRMAGASNGLDRQSALGLGLRPLRKLPVAVLGEARLQQDMTGTRLRPAVALVSELPPLALPLGVTGEVYGQAGWVGGRGATPFYDVQALADRSVVHPWHGADLRLGAGAWSGGQRGAVRLDIGPRASLRLRVRGVPVRVSADWRFRVAGHAAPGSGPALTLSTGF